MTHEELMLLPIECVEEKVFSDKSMWISFNLKKFRMVLNLHHIQDNQYKIRDVVHYFQHNDPCPFCQKAFIPKCLVLNKHREILFQRLIETPSIRLEWLYRSYINP